MSDTERTDTRGPMTFRELQGITAAYWATHSDATPTITVSHLTRQQLLDDGWDGVTSLRLTRIRQAEGHKP